MTTTTAPHVPSAAETASTTEASSTETATAKAAAETSSAEAAEAAHRRAAVMGRHHSGRGRAAESLAGCQSTNTAGVEHAWIGRATALSKALQTGTSNSALPAIDRSSATGRARTNPREALVHCPRPAT
jgi:hypothetical protein